MRAWLHAESEQRYFEFCKGFAFELQAPFAQAALARIRSAKKTHSGIKLMTGCKDPAHSDLLVPYQALSAS